MQYDAKVLTSSFKIKVLQSSGSQTLCTKYNTSRGHNMLHPTWPVQLSQRPHQTFTMFILSQNAHTSLRWEGWCVCVTYMLLCVYTCMHVCLFFVISIGLIILNNTDFHFWRWEELLTEYQCLLCIFLYLHTIINRDNGTQLCFQFSAECRHSIGEKKDFEREIKILPTLTPHHTWPIVA